VIARLVLVLALLVAARAAVAQPAGAAAEPGAVLDAAAAALAAGDYPRTIELAKRALARPATKPDRAEAHRLVGLATFFLGDTGQADHELLAYLRLDPDARLDPAVVPPEAITFFEDVRARNAAELNKLRPRQRRYSVLNLIPPAGQFQNRDRIKGWTLGAVELGLVATNLTSYFMLRSWCSRDDFTCESDGSDVPDKARTARTVNYVSGLALIGVYVYGVIDGYYGYRRRGREHAPPVVTVAPLADGGAVVGASLSF